MDQNNNITNENQGESKPNTEIQKINEEPKNPNTEINTSSQNQIQEVKPEENIPEISNEKENKEVGKDIQPIQDQQINKPENQPQADNQVQSQPQPQPQPQLPIQNKIVFSHQMHNYCSEEKIKEIENCPPMDLFAIVNKRKEEVSFKLQDILSKHERYTIFQIYYKILKVFITSRQYGKDPQAFFQAKDPSLRMKISIFDFSDVLNMLNCQLRTEEFNLILKSLTQKTNTLYSYDEFLKKVYNIQADENGQMRAIYKQCSFYFNDYLYSFRHYIQDNKIDYKSAYIRVCGGMTTLTYELFSKFLDEIGFKIGHEQEKQFLFSSLCENNYFEGYIYANITGYALQKTLFEMAELSDISEEDFIKSGAVNAESAKKNTDWIKNIKNYTEETKQLYKQNYKSFEPTFKGIHEKCIRYDVNDLTTYFAESGEDISPEGEIDVEAFKKLMNNIGVAYNVQFDTLISQFRTKNKLKNTLQLADFISTYNLFIDDDKIDVNKNSSGIKFDEEEKLKGTNLVPENVNYIFKNAHRKFTQEDINYISDFCSGIADIIIEELHDSVTNFFHKKDKKNGGFLFLDEFKEILEKELQISLEGTQQEMDDFNIFFDFVTADKMVKGSDIVEIKKLIHVITYYSGKDGPSQTIKNVEQNNLGNSNSNNKINFEEENNPKGTEAPNLNENKEKNQNQNINEDINTNSSNINNINNNNQLLTTNINTSVKSFDKLMSNFAQCLSNNRIRFSDAFPSINLDKIINNQTISKEEVQKGFYNANFKVSEEELSVIMGHFDPTNSGKIFVEDLKHEIAKYQPKYFTQSYQKVIQPIISKNNIPISTFSRDMSKSDLLNGMNKIQSFLNTNNISPENFFYGTFCKKNRNGNEQINKEIWKNAFIPKEKIRSDIIPYLEAREVDAIYVEMNPKLFDNILLSQIIEFFEKYMNKNENMMKFDDQTSLNETIKNEIKILFDNFDVNKTEQISFDDFYKCLKSVDHKATKGDAQDILAQHTNKNFSNVDRDTFNVIIYNYIKKLLFIQKEEKDYIKNLFLEADIDKNGFLTRNQIKYLINHKINCNLTDSELNEILDKVDIRNENEIDIRDFIFLLDNINNSNFNNTNMINTMSNADDNENIPIMNLNLNLNMYRRIRPKDFISLYTGLPLSFIPSFIREEQQKNKLLPSSCLKPLTINDILYQDISPIDTIIYTNNTENQISGIIQAKKLKEVSPIVNCKIYLDDYATGVSSPDETLFETPNSQFKVVGRLLKVSLFNNMYKVFVGNAVSIDCIYKKEYQDRWYFEDDDSKYNNNIIIRYNKNDYKELDVVMEFVLVIQKKVEQKLYTVETSCGWCSIPMQNLLVARKEKLKIMGGSPLSVTDISEKDIRKKRIGFIPKLATLFEGQINSECPIRVKLYNDLSNDEKKYINYLPSILVCHSAAIHMISLYRQELAEYILNHKDYLLKSIKDEFDLGNMFCKIADVPDAFRVMNEIWKEIVVDAATSDQRNNEGYFRAHFEIFVKKIHTVLYAEKFKYNPLDPTELPRGDIKLMQDRDILLNSALRSGLDKKFNKLEYKMDDYSYKPFTMDEINGQKGNSILEKLDETIISIIS